MNFNKSEDEIMIKIIFTPFLYNIAWFLQIFIHITVIQFYFVDI